MAEERPAENRFIKYDPVADIPNEEGFLTQPQPAIQGGGPSNQMAPEAPLFQQKEQPLFTNPPQSTGYATENTLIEVGLLQAPEQYDARLSNNKAGEGALNERNIHTIGNEYLAALWEAQKDGSFSNDIMLLSQEQFELLDTPEKKTEYLQKLMLHHDLRDQSTRLKMVVELINRYGADTDPVMVDRVLEGLTWEQRDSITRGVLSEAKDALRVEVDSIAATLGWDSIVEGTVDAAVQEFIPVANVGTKLFFNKWVMDRLGIPEDKRTSIPTTGDQRQVLREFFAEEGPVATREHLISLKAHLQHMKETDPVASAIFRNYLIIEQFEAIFTDDLIESGNADFPLDKWIGRFETGMELIASAWLLTRATKLGANKGLRAAFSAVDTNVLNRTARHAGRRDAQANMDRIVQGEAARELDIEPGEAALNLMPRPSTFVDERTIKLPGVEETVERSNSITSRILESTRQSLAKVMTQVERTGVKLSEYEKLFSIMDHARVAPAMSIIRASDMDDGVHVVAVLSKTGNQGYRNFDEVATELVQMDPNMEHLTVLRRGEDGKLQPVPLSGPDELLRVVTNNPRGLSDEALSEKFADAVAGNREMEILQLERELTRRSGEQSVSQVLDDEYFLQYDHFRAYHPVDKVAFGADTIRHTKIPLGALSPNMKFGDDLYGATQWAINQDARINRLFADLYQPYYKLNAEGKRNVSQVFGWMEDEAQRLGRDLDLYEVISEFPDLTPAEIQGIVAVRAGLDGQHSVLNRRLWREYNGLGFKTARPLSDGLPIYHGKVIEGGDLKSGVVYDPVTQEQIRLSKADVANLEATGGKLIELDVPIDVPGSNGLKRAKTVLLESNTYRVKNLDEDILPRYAGYRYRFYEDPYYIVRRQSGVTVDGVASTSTVETAFRTAGSRLEGEQFLNRGNFSKDGNVWVDADGDIYDIVPAKQLDQVDTVLKQKEALQREGRMFLDTRQQEPLLNTNGNQSEIMDFTRALERGTSLSTRMNTHEDMLRTLRNALAGTYKLPELDSIKVKTRDIKIIVDDLKKGLNNAAGNPELQQTYREALTIAKYIRQIEGVDAAAIPFMRNQVLRLATWADRLGGKPGKFGSVEKWAMTMDPLRAMRSTAFGAFMVLRPGRQLLLQMSQPLFLTGIDPLYVISGRGLRDSILLRSAFGALRHANYVSDGLSMSNRARMMGLSKKELTRLVDKLDKSGTLDVVDLHSFSGGTRRWQQIAPSDGTLSSGGKYAGKKAGSVVWNTLKTFGFDTGEEINKLGTFNIAYRRLMKQKGYDSLLQITDAEWRQVYKDTENLSLAMNKAGAFPYQSGLLSVPTQFLSFTHKVGLSLLAQNPSLSKKEVAKIWAGMFALYGADMFGARTQTREAMYELGLDDSVLGQELPGGGTVMDLLSAGLIQTYVNQIGNMTTQDWKDLNTTSIGPVFNARQFMEMFFEGVSKRPFGTIFGPFGNRFNAFMEAAEFTNLMLEGHTGSIIDRTAIMADMAARKLLPQYSDATLAYLHWKNGYLLTNNGTTQQIDPSLFSVWVRGTVGMRTLEEEADFRRRELQWEDDALKRDLINSTRQAVLQYISLWRAGDISTEMFHDRARMVGEIVKMAPEHMQQEIIQAVLAPELRPEMDPAQAPNNALAGAVLDRQLTKGQAKALLNEIPMPADQRQAIHEFIEYSYDDSPMNQEELTRQMIKQHTREQ